MYSFSTGSDVDARVAVHALHRAVIAHRPGRLLEPGHAEVRELAAEGDSLDRVEVTVDVDHDRQFVAEAAAQALDVVDRHLVQLDRADASITGALGFVDDKLRVPKRRQARIGWAPRRASIRRAVVSPTRQASDRAGPTARCRGPDNAIGKMPWSA